MNIICWILVVIGVWTMNKAIKENRGEDQF